MSNQDVTNILIVSIPFFQNFKLPKLLMEKTVQINVLEYLVIKKLNNRIRSVKFYKNMW